MICAMVEAMCWPMSALPQVTVTIPSGAIEYQTLGSKLLAAANAWSAPRDRTEIAERQARGGRSDEEGAAAEIAIDDILGDFHVRIHVALRSVPALEAVRISEAARMIAFWMRE